MVAGRLKRLPLSTGIVYLGIGILLGPMGADQFYINPIEQSALFETLTEIAVLLSVFAAGLKVPAPLGNAVWYAPFRLATVSMVITVFLVAAAAMLLLNLPLGAAVLLGAVLAPTDPVLASDIQVTGPRDRSNLRFGLTAEAGINDGTAFPMVMLGLGLLGLHELGDGLVRWLTVDVLWACGSAVAIGGALGMGTAWLAKGLLRDSGQSEFTEDFLGLGLVALSNGLTVLAGGYGFLAVFAAGYMLRRTELQAGPLIEPPRSPDRQIQAASADHRDAYMSQVSLTFVEQIERLSELALLILVGGMLFRNSWQIEFVLMALILFLVIRPLATFVGLAGNGLPLSTKATMGWFGVRGIGTFYYLMYAVEHGLDESLAVTLVSVVLIVITLSVILHGVTVMPVMRMHRRWGS
jgi:NhaP-type Na+/H+ or K+/H+ antiporter